MIAFLRRVKNTGDMNDSLTAANAFKSAVADCNSGRDSPQETAWGLKQRTLTGFITRRTGATCVNDCIGERGANGKPKRARGWRGLRLLNHADAADTGDRDEYDDRVNGATGVCQPEQRAFADADTASRYSCESEGVDCQCENDGVWHNCETCGRKTKANGGICAFCELESH